jgi:hypothetical protein
VTLVETKWRSGGRKMARSIVKSVIRLVKAAGKNAISAAEMTMTTKMSPVLAA